MKCHYQMYRHTVRQNPYESYITNKIELQKSQERQKYYSAILEFRESRYPRELMEILNKEINPFELPVEKFKVHYNKTFPFYSNELVQQAVEFVFRKKCEESKMVKESPIVIEEGEEKILNGRKLQKEDFTYHYSRLMFEEPVGGHPQNFSIQDSRRELSDLESSTRREHVQREDKYDKEQSKEKMHYDVEGQKGNEVMKSKIERLNWLIREEINREKKKFENLELIEMESANDSLYYENLSSRRERKEKGSITERREEVGEEREHEGQGDIPLFKEADLLKQAEGFDTGRSEIEELNLLLGRMIVTDGEEGGETSGRSKGVNYRMKISDDVMDDLYSARGKLKIDLVRRVVDKLKKDKGN